MSSWSGESADNDLALRGRRLEAVERRLSELEKALIPPQASPAPSARLTPELRRVLTGLLKNWAEPLGSQAWRCAHCGERVSWREEPTLSGSSEHSRNCVVVSANAMLELDCLL